DLARLGAGEAQRGAALLHRQAARGLPFVWRERRVAVDDGDAFQIELELVGCDLRQRGADALAQLDLAAEDRHAAIRVDAQPGVQHAVAVEAAGQARRGSLRERKPGSEGKADDQRPASLEELAAGRARAHERICFAARCTARTMRLCEAQRHRWPFSACLIWRAVGARLRSSSALADITMPLPQ